AHGEEERVGLGPGLGLGGDRVAVFVERVAPVRVGAARGGGGDPAREGGGLAERRLEERRGRVEVVEGGVDLASTRVDEGRRQAARGREAAREREERRDAHHREVAGEREPLRGGEADAHAGEAAWAEADGEQIELALV